MRIIKLTTIMAICVVIGFLTAFLGACLDNELGIHLFSWIFGYFFCLFMSIVMN